MKVSIIISWFVILAILVLLKVFVFTKEKLKAENGYNIVRELPVGHQLGREDFTPVIQADSDTFSMPVDSLLGLHLTSHKGVNHKLMAKDLALLPRIKSTAVDSIVAMITLQKEEVIVLNLVDSGSIVHLYGEEPVEKGVKRFVLENVKVAAKHHQTAKVPGNHLFVQIAKAKLLELGPFLSAKSRLIIVN
jgi:hypothetical protein